MKKNKGFKRIVKAIYNSIKGIKFVIKSEEAFLQEICLFLLLTPIMFIIETNTSEKLFLLFSMFLVLITEIINSAIESTIDRISLEYNILSGKVKDMSSAAVFLALIMMIISYMVIFIPKIFSQ
jgi:diacylglycerol kinase (ATP)